MNPAPRCYSIPAGTDFLPALARFLLDRYGKNPAALTRVLVLLPNRRACRSLREAFLEVSSGKPMLLPRIQPIGEIEEEAASGAFATFEAVLPPVIPPMRRELLLTRLVMDFENRQRGIDFSGIEQAAELARRLAQFMDEVAREGLDHDALTELVPQELALHWQQTLDFLRIVFDFWPRILKEEGASDPVAHRNLLLSAIAEAWKISPPDYPVIAAGSTGSQKATADLLAAISHLPQGCIVLPGLDRDMAQSEWEHVGPTHPQFHLKQLLGNLKINRGEVVPLGEEKTPRIETLRLVFAAPDATAKWRSTTLNEGGFKNLRALTGETLLDEARLIAVALREILETPGKTAALITPDRPLARMVAAQMQRFGIEIDDSAGKPLSETLPGGFLLQTIEMAMAQAAPVPLLSVLRHPLTGCGLATAECRQLSRQLEIQHLRGIRHAPGLAALRKEAGGDVKVLLTSLEKNLKSLADLLKRDAVPLSALLTSHLAIAEFLASTNEQSGSERLWAGEAGEDLAAYLAELIAQADILPRIDPMAYGGLLEQLLARRRWRPRYGQHPRLHILSPMEARLLSFDRVILGGLNEGSWPEPPEADPWMSRPMRAAFGLPPADRAIGQSAHDIAQLAAAPEVLLTRARKVEGTPTVPSRWLMRLATLVENNESLKKQIHDDDFYHRAKSQLDAPLPMEALVRPAPTPPLAARPRKLRVTAIEIWRRDPYMLYAQYILGLRPLDAIDQEPDAADFGMLVHNALERFLAASPQALPKDPREALLKCGEAAFAELIDRPAVAALWWPRFAAMSEFIIAIEIERRALLTRVLGEVKGEWQWDVGGADFTLTTHIDRIEVSKDGLATIVDYKTGSLPAMGDIERGLASQLPLEALILRHGVLSPSVEAQQIKSLEYWKLGGSAAQSEIKKIKDESIEQINAWLEETRARLEETIRHYGNPATAYAAESNPAILPRYNDYAHLTRRDEWEAV